MGVRASVILCEYYLCLLPGEDELVVGGQLTVVVEAAELARRGEAERPRPEVKLALLERT